MHFRKRLADYSDIAEITLIKPGDLLFLYTDGVYDGSDLHVRAQDSLPSAIRMKRKSGSTVTSTGFRPWRYCYSRARDRS